MKIYKKIKGVDTDMKMKAFLLFTILFGLTGVARAGGRQDDSDFINTATATVVTVSPTVWTLIPNSTGTITGRNGLWIDHRAGNVNNVMIYIGTSTLAPGSTIYGFTYAPSDNPWILSLSRFLKVWAISDTLSQEIIVQDFN